MVFKEMLDWILDSKERKLDEKEYQIILILFIHLERNATVLGGVYCIWMSLTLTLFLMK